MDPDTAVPLEHRLTEQAATIDRLTAVITRQRAMITAMAEATERRFQPAADDSAFGRWENNLLLQQEVETRTRRTRAAERLLRSVVDSLDARMCILGDDGVIIGTNRLWDEFAVSMGWDELRAGIGADFFELVNGLRGELKTTLVTAARQVLAPDAEQVSVKGYLPVAGRGEDVVVRMDPVHDHEAARVVVTMIDITTAVRTQRELRRITDEAQLLALVAQHTDNAVVISDVEGRIEWANTAFCRMSGYSSDELIGLRREDLMQGPSTRTPGFTEFVAALAAGRGADVQFPTQNKDGRSYWAHVEVQPIVEDGRTVRFVSVERDMTDQRAAEEQLRAAIRQAQTLAEALSTEKTLLSEVLASIPHLVYWKDGDLRYTGVNQAFLALRGLDDESAALERTETELAVTDRLSDVLNSLEPGVLSSGEPAENQRLQITAPGRGAVDLLLSVLPQTDETGRVCGVIGVAADVTHLTTLEQQLAQATRLESIGQLAAGIAHEINTPVQYVSDNTRFLTEAFTGVLTALRTIDELATSEPGDNAAGDEPLATRLKAVLAGMDLEFLADEIPGALSQSAEGLARVAQIVRAMKDFSHPGQGRAEADLNRAVESTVQVSRNEWRYVAQLDLDLGPQVGLVRCFEGELKQVLLNIVVNAAQAIAGERERTSEAVLGHIGIRTERIEDAVRITISDDGPGMEDAVCRKIFDPFFTTKPVGKGTGQGLSMAYAVIVQKHGGSLSVSSVPGEGSVFTIDLPDRPDAPVLA
jgi:PAS domain S-box-containing protein